jgi:hypothetical protein
LTSSSSAIEEKEKQIEDLDSSFKLGIDLVNKLNNYFESSSNLKLNDDNELSYLFDILPANLKI